MITYEKPTALEKKVNHDVNTISTDFQFRKIVIIWILTPFSLFFLGLIVIITHLPWWALPMWIDTVFNWIWGGMICIWTLLMIIPIYIANCFGKIESISEHITKQQKIFSIMEILDQSEIILSGIKRIYFLRFLMYTILTQSSSRKVLVRIQNLVLDRISPLLKKLRSGLENQLVNQGK